MRIAQEPVCAAVWRPWLGLVAVIAVVAGAGCRSTGVVPRPFPTPGPRSPAATVPGTSIRTPPGPIDGYAIANAALALQGSPYRSGGTDPSGFDCSGLVQYVFAEYGVASPRLVRDQYTWGRPLRANEIAPGDLVFFATDSGVSHVGIAIGEGRFVHAPSARGMVRVESLGSEYWSRRFVGARRVE
jgi:cell wall-associated NlpC family hydrolase